MKNVKVSLLLIVLGSFIPGYAHDTYLNDEIFKNKSNGTFVEIGAFDGIVESQSYFFEKELGWRGICVEPLRSAYEKLRKNRTCICFHGAIAAVAGSREFVQVYGRMQRMSGFVNTYYRQNWKIINGEDRFGGGWRIAMVPTYTFNTLCADNHLEHIDLLAINTCGSEEEIVRSIDFDRFDITVISLENPYGNITIESYLVSKKYQLYARRGTTDIYKKDLVSE